MKLKLPLVAAFVAILSLSACGGGGDGGSSGGNNVVVANPAAFSKTELVVGTGAEAVTGKSATVVYTGWLYSETAADHKGTRFDGGTFTYQVGTQVIKGFDQGVQGMKVGGKRTVLIPSSLGYGTAGSPPTIPSNAGLVFDIELTAVK